MSAAFHPFEQYFYFLQLLHIFVNKRIVHCSLTYVNHKELSFTYYLYNTSTSTKVQDSFDYKQNQRNIRRVWD